MDSLQTLRHHRDVVALETFSVQALDVTGMLKQIFPDIKKHFLDFTQRFSGTDKPVPLSRHQASFMKLLERHNYVDISPLTVYCPEGMKGTYLELAAVLKRGAEHSAKVMDLLNQYTTYLALLITNEYQRFSTENSAKVYQGLQEARTSLLKDIGACFNPGRHDTTMKYGEAVARNKDWELVFGEVDTLSKLSNSVSREKLNAKVKEATQYMEKIVQMLKDGKMESTAYEVAQELSEGAYQIACELEFFSTMYFRVMAFNTSINESVDKITDNLKS
jgi:hypothetical protein